MGSARSATYSDGVSLAGGTMSLSHKEGSEEIFQEAG